MNAWQNLNSDPLGSSQGPTEILPLNSCWVPSRQVNSRLGKSQNNHLHLVSLPFTPTTVRNCDCDNLIMASRRDFLSQPAPENYVAGLGRGATGFTTRSDLGPAREGPSEDQIKAAVEKRTRQLGLSDSKDDDNEDEARFQDPDSEVGLFAGGIYEKDDEEADRIWQEVDEKMARRRQKQRLVIPFSSLAAVLHAAQAGSEAKPPDQVVAAPQMQ